MEEQLITLETAKLAKEKGFITKTVTTGFTNDYLLGGKNVMITEMCIYLWMCELQKWLREVHKIVLLIHQYDDNKKYSYLIDEEFIYEFGTRNPNYNIYEEALEIGLQEALKLIK